MRHCEVADAVCLPQNCPKQNNDESIASIIFSMLSTPEASRDVFEGDAGTLAGVSAGKFIIDCATLAEDDMKSMCECIQSKGG